jgi:hypothetical protein
MGSVLAVHIVFTPCWIYFAICKLIWMKTRGYPFSIGDRVLITGGKYRGYEAEIIHYCQSEIEYGICIKELKYENLEFYAGYLMAKHKLENDTNK